MKALLALMAALALAGCTSKEESAARQEDCITALTALIKSGGKTDVNPWCRSLSQQDLEAAMKEAERRNPGHTLSLASSPQKQPEPEKPKPPEEPKKPVWSEDVARSEANRIFALVEKAETDLKAAIETHDSAGFARYVTRPLSVEIQRWHEHDHPYQFSPCHDAAIALHGYAMTLYAEYLSGGPFDGVMVRRERKINADLLKEGKTACAKALKG